MNNQVVWVTGGTAGMGLAVAQAFSAAGARLAVTPGNGSRAARKAARALGGMVVPGVAEHEAEGMARAVVRKMGRLDVLVNAAGFCEPAPGARGLEALTDRDWNRVMGGSLRGAYACSRAAARVMKRGTIVNLAWASSLTGASHGILEQAAGAGVVGLTKGLAVALAPRIRVNCLALGSMGAERGPGSRRRAAEGKAPPAGRRGTSRDVGALALFLAENEFVTGQTVVLDGGEARV
jgi:NAD(P)-dependent dehydrogenase (short-subunit alcohol dehydrogenase family)